MNTQRSRLKRVTIFLICIFVSFPAISHADWSIIGLGTLGGTSSSAEAINDSGQVVGNASTASGDSHAFITGLNGVGMTDLGVLGGRAINDSGQVAGTFLAADNTTHAFITGSDGVGMTDLGAIGKVSVIVQGMNTSGQVVGFSIVDADFNFLAFMTGPNGVGVTNLDTTFGGIQSVANAINDSGQVVGAAELDRANLISHAFITGPGNTDMTDLGTLGGPTSSAFDVNNSGQVVGRADTDGGDSHAYITGPNGVGMTDLGTLGGSFSFATDINDAGEAAGFAGTTNNSETHAFLFSHGGITDLSLLDPGVAGGWTNLTVRDINNNGQMVGFGTNSDGNQEAFLLSYTTDTIFNPRPIFIPPDSPPPIPEPQTYAMLLAGLGLLGFATAHRRRKLQSV